MTGVSDSGRTIRISVLDSQLSIFDLEGVARHEPSALVGELREAERVAEQLLFASGDKALVRDDEGLYARVVHRHSAKKAWYVRRYAQIVGTAMASHWPGKLWWVELFAGPGRLFDTDSGRYLTGSPIEAVTIERPFAGYVFGDLDPTCTSSLESRLDAYPNTHVLQGDANSPELLDRVAAIVPRDARHRLRRPRGPGLPPADYPLLHVPLRARRLAYQLSSGWRGSLSARRSRGAGGSGAGSCEPR